MSADNKISLFTIASILAACSFSWCADLPAEQPRSAPDSGNATASGSHAFSVHDIDKNGVLSREEYRIFIEQMELRRRAEGRDRHHYPVPLRFEEIDANADGYLTEDEMTASLNKRLQRHRRYRYQRGRER